MSLTIVLLTDLHYSKQTNESNPDRAGEWANLLLLRAVHRINRYIKPDVTILAGDLIDQPDAHDAFKLLAELKSITDKLDMPLIAIPGNHDPDPEAFYSVFKRPDDFIDIGNCRILPFLDKETPGYNAFRSPEDIARLRQLGSEFDGPVITVQHVPVFPSDACDCPYNLDDAKQVLSAMYDAGVCLSLAGHRHAGFELKDAKGVKYITSAALCEFPFSYQIIEVSDSGVCTSTKEALGWDRPEKLNDMHIHTQLAYCNENMSPEKAINFGRILGVTGLGFNEHTTHLYFSRNEYYDKLPFREGIQAAAPENNRVVEYLNMVYPLLDDNMLIGMEVDFDNAGAPIVKTDLMSNTEIVCGALHRSTLSGTRQEANEKFLYMTRKILESGVRFLAHPFRVFRRSGLERPPELYAPLAQLLAEYDVAAEINFHTNDPDPEFFRKCQEHDVKLVFGSDSHNLYEVGEFYGFMKLLRQIGAGNRLDEVMLDPFSDEDD